jgi:voltage-gated potassium channel
VEDCADAANWLIWAIFVAELAFVLVVAPRKKAALRAHALDVGIVIFTAPFYAEKIAAFRLLRLLRALVLIGRALVAERRLTSTNAFRFTALSTIFLTVIAGAVQSTIDTGDFPKFWEGVWWAVVTVTTVGYGDTVPHTVGGRVVAIVLMFVGLGFIAVLTATIAAYFVKTDEQAEDESRIVEALRPVLDALARVEGELTEVKSRLDAQSG